MALPSPPPPYSGPERRAHPRISAASVPHLQAMVAGGPPVRLLDLSKRGVQLETTLHMHPGATVAIRFISGEAAMTLVGAVVRCTSAVIEEGGDVTYHTGLAFTDELTLCGDELDAVARAAGDVVPHATAGQADDYTMIVLDGRAPEGPRQRTPSEC